MEHVLLLHANVEGYSTLSPEEVERSKPRAEPWV